MIDYDKIHHCLTHIIADHEDSESVLHSAKHALQLLEIQSSKYKMGQDVWFVDRNNKISHAEIDEVDELSDEKYYIRTEHWWFMEHELHETKERLIQAQIEYWHKQLCQELERDVLINVSYEGETKVFCESRVASHAGCEDDRYEECQHESDGWWYEKNHETRGRDPRALFILGLSENDIDYKCLKCGEFYK